MMASKNFFVPFLALVVVVAAKPDHGHHGNGGSVPDSGQVDAAIVNIELHYNDKLCLELLLVDCATHVTQGDEKVCGTDGVTYENHCKFAHAMCEFAYSNNQVKLASHGACPTATALPASTMPAATAPPASTIPPVSTMKSSSTSAPATDTGTRSTEMKTTVAMTTTTVMLTTTAATSTVDPIHAIVQNVFCKNTASISCVNDFQIICGSDGQLYPNQCEMSKQKCVDKTLTVVDMSACPIPGP